MGVTIALLIIFIWGSHLFYILSSVSVNPLDPVFYIHILLQAYFYTGLFITAHDAMHKTVSRKRIINKLIGGTASFLFAGLSYNRLVENHMKHHKFAGTENDPDFSVHHSNFILWWLQFMYRYTTLTQLIVMGAVFNLLDIWFDQISIWFFWVIPAFLGTLQLFYFGTYLPHKRPHSHSMEPHKARSQKKNHLLAMLSCYFFGYHFEHHEHPHIPWWQLYRIK